MFIHGVLDISCVVSTLNGVSMLVQLFRVRPLWSFQAVPCEAFYSSIMPVPNQHFDNSPLVICVCMVNHPLNMPLASFRSIAVQKTDNWYDVSSFVQTTVV